MRLLTHMFLILAVATGFVQASEISGYIGSQSFRLNDDPDLNSVLRRAEDAKVDVARADQVRSQIADQLRGLENQQAQLKERMESLNREIESAKNRRQAFQSTLSELQKSPEVNAEAIKVTTNQIAEVDALISDRSRQAGALKLESAPINVRIDQVRNDLVLATRKSDDSRQRLQIAVRQAEDYRQEIIEAIKKINYEGARIGQNDGGSDGAALSARLGYERGSADGKNDGFTQGTVDGQDRWYKRGADQGERDGASRARIDGQRDGLREGTISGNQSAAHREGSAAGVKRGDASNAAAVGIAQGKTAGMERAVSTGQADGRNIGESETTKKHESGTLNSVNLNGAFAGSFQRRTPDYPGDFNGSAYRPNISHSKDIMRRAYADGYNFNYRQYTQYEFQRRIATDYNQNYDSSYRAAYDAAVNREYPAHFDQGRRDGDARAYGRDYPLVKAEAFRAAFAQFDASPNRASAEFKSTYASSELSAYNRRYEEIRSANFDRVELEVFNQNIAAQTEIYRQKRIGEVNVIYNNNAVLQFVSSEMLDGGIKGVALLDGVFQPGETTNHNVVLRNFGFKEATNVTVMLENGQSVKLPNIPARSQTSLKGVIQGSVAGNIGGSMVSNLRVVSPLTTNDAVEGRHYDKLVGGILKSAEQKIVKVGYPLALSGLGIDSQLLKGTKNKLKITLTNNSKRQYAGEIKIKLLVNSQNSIVKKDFSVVSTLATSTTLNDAEVLVEAEQDAYRDLSFSATVEQNGVLLGVLPSDFVTMAKAQFFDKGKVPVLVANSDTHLRGFLDALSDLGGSENVSILDLSLSGLNAATVANGLSQKVLLIVDDSNGSSIKSLNGFIGKSKSSTFLFIDENNTGLKNAQALGSLKDAVKLTLDKRQLVFSNQHRAAGVVASSTFIQSSLRSFKNDLGLAQNLTLTAPEMLAEIKSKVSPEKYATPNTTLKIYSTKALSEVLAINMAYDESGGIFSRDKKWAKMIEEDKSLFHNQLKAASAGDVVTSKLPVILAAIAMKDTVSQAMKNDNTISRDMKLKISNATNDVLDDMEKSYDKNLKKNFKDLYTKAHAYKQVHRPFAIAEPAPNYGN